MLLFVVSGVWSYLRLGRDEDPPFTVKTMIVATAWPGATIEETTLQVTDRIEKKLQETQSLDYLKSYTQSGQSTTLLVLKESTPPEIVPAVSDKVRKKVDDIRSTLIIHVRRGDERDLARVARLVLRQAVGLVLSGGGARAFAHIGVIKAFAEAGIPIDLVAGTSMGAMVAASVVLGHQPDVMIEKFLRAFKRNPIADYAVPIIALRRVAGCGGC